MSAITLPGPNPFEKAQLAALMNSGDRKWLLQEFGDDVDFGDILPFTLKLAGKPMDVKTRRPMFAPLFRKNRESVREIYLCARQVAKALDVRTPIPTPNGWTTMGQVRVGDLVFGSDGKPTKVNYVSPIIKGRTCYEITFDTGEVITADAGHLWAVDIKKSGLRAPMVVTTEELNDLLPSRKKSLGLPIKPCQPLDISPKDLPIDPYILGYWIGDIYAEGDRVYVTPKGYADFRQKLNSLGEKVCDCCINQKRGYCVQRIAGLDIRLAALGLHDKHKHIPAAYLRGSIEQRLELLRGLMDGGGRTRTNGNCVFPWARAEFLEQVEELLSSLGIKSRRSAKSAIEFRTRLSVFWLKSDDAKRPTPCSHRIRSIKKVDSVPVRCIRVDNESHLFLCGKSMIPTHNTTSAAASIMMNMIMREYFRIMYVAPLQIYTQRIHQVHLDPFIRTCMLDDPIMDNTCVNNVNSKTFLSGSQYHGISVYNSPAQALGTSIDSLIFDECLSEQTLISVPGARKKILDLHAGQEILAFDEDGNTHVDKIKSITHKGIRSTWRLTFDNGEQLECTDNEKFWTDQGWLFLQKIINAATEKRRSAAMDECPKEPESCFHRGDLPTVRFYGQSDKALKECELVKLEPIGEQAVWDIETEKYHTFFANGIAVHNCQDLNLDFIPQIRETLRTSDFRWESYFGTARGVENTIQSLFDESSQGEWFIRCWNCHKWIEPTKEKHAISMIQKQGVSCPFCMAGVCFELGEWVHRYPDRISQFAGYHVPATIVRDVCMPHDRYLATIYDKLYGVSRYSEAKFFQEVLGISTDQGGRPITPEEVRRASILKIGDSYGPANLYEYSSITGGADWGGSEIISFTVGTTVGYHHSGKFHCLGAIRPMGIPDNERHLPLAAFFQRTGGRQMLGIAADAGFVGSVQNRNLEKVSGIRTASIAYGTQRHFFKGLQGRNFIVDRTTLIYIVYSLIREGHLFFPEGREFESYTNDLMATFIEDTEAPNGMTARRYCRIKTKADDFLHALGYAIFLCAITSNIDLPGMLGLGARTSLNASFIDMAGEEGDQIFHNWNA